jgi:hypothetical protein
MSQADDLAAKMPDKLAQMKDLFLVESAKFSAKKASVRLQARSALTAKSNQPADPCRYN